MNLNQLSIKYLAYNAAWYISKVRNENNKQKYIYYYIIQGFLGDFVRLSVLLFISALLGMVIEFLLCMIVLGSLRMFSGGFHASSHFKCFIYTFFIVLFVCLLSYLLFEYLSIHLSLIFFTIAFYLVYKLAPKDHPNKPINSDKLRNILRIRSLIICFLWFIISITLVLLNKPMFSLIISFSLLIQALTLTDIFSNFSNKIENSCTKIFCTRI